MPGLFSIFNTAKSGLFSQQTAVNVTSHNIANANTEGYSRQRANMVTTTPYTMPSMNGAAGAGQIGTGVTVSSIDRIRDIFLDYQYRIENGVNGHFTGRDKYLSQVENVLNEPGDTGLSSLMGNFFDSWQNLNTSPTNNTTVVAQQALQLTDSINHTYSQLNDLVGNAQEGIKTDVLEINQIIDQLNNINQQIRDVNISGNNPNDLMDKRDLFLDKLSGKFGISVDSKSYDGIDVTTTNSSIYGSASDNGAAPLGDDKKPLNIVQSIGPDDEDVATFSYVSTVTTSETVDASKPNQTHTYAVSYYKKGNMQSDDNKVTINVNMTASQANDLLKYRVLWANHDGEAYKVKNAVDEDHNPIKDSSGNQLKAIDGTISGTVGYNDLAIFHPPTGELKGYMSVQDDIQGYQDQLNKLAKSLALSVNAIISQSSSWVADNSGSPEGGINNFFVNGDKKANNSAHDENAIDASNITVNVAIMEDPSKIKTDLKYDSDGNALSTDTDGKRALAVAQLRDTLLNIQSIDENGTVTSRKSFIDNIFKPDDTLNGVYTLTNTAGGSNADNYFRGIINTVGTQEQTAKNEIATGAEQLASYEQSRASTSGVSIDEEMTNLIQFQHCYQANAKMISTVDELLDVVINGLKR
ncbi:flagellar hook-associated protein FlgK [Clostridium tyrobutyricum]|uniref:flagellar hook-associated protein FlgK n=1 Tax=Clostridium tyrobutyricum TaxID=1519 RepID=UPI0018AA1DC4|nr:flagellar hook-associated protein FlgK [Clostridium tyrobutyricum]